MQGFEIIPDDILIGATKNSGTISLNRGYIVHISSECFDDTQENLQVSLRGGPWITAKPGENARQRGGFEACNVPGHFTGDLKWRFINPVTNEMTPRVTAAGQNRGLIILTRISKSTKEIE